jgi:cell division protein FtsZ
VVVIKLKSVMMQFDLQNEENSIIKVFGVGGGGTNAVNHMYKQGIKGVDFYVCNTDEQSLDMSPVPNKIQLGLNLTGGRGAGSIAEVGMNAAIENLEEIKEILGTDTKMLFITAGMGGGTGTGAAPIIAQAAKELGILTVGIVTYPFMFEGRKRSTQANNGLEELRESVDTCVIICNDKLREIYGNLSLSDAFAKADDILTVAAKGIAEVITRTGYINVDFEDVRTVMTDSGVAIMGRGQASGENRAKVAAEAALSSPLLNDNDIEGANYILLNISSGSNEVMMDEITEITDFIQDEAGSSADIIWGTGVDEELGDNISITLIATGFQANKSIGGIQSEKKKTKVVHNLSIENKIEEKVEVATESVNALEPTLKTAESEQIEMKLDVSSTERKQEVAPNNHWGVQKEIKNEVSINEAKPLESEPAKIVHNLYDEKEVASGSGNEDAEKENDAPTFEFESSQNRTEEVEDKATPFTPNFVSKERLTPPAEPKESGSTFSEELDAEERMKRSQERLSQLNNLSKKMKTPSGINDLENEPAYLRRKVKLNSVNHSSETNVSRFTLGDDGENNPEIRSNNSFLHDNVD